MGGFNWATCVVSRALSFPGGSRSRERDEKAKLYSHATLYCLACATKRQSAQFVLILLSLNLFLIQDFLVQQNK